MTEFDENTPFEMSANLFLICTTPCVYAWVRGRDPIIYLYIGCSKRGIGRVLYHDLINIIESISPDDRILIWHTRDYRKLEEKLIIKHKPKYNGARTGYIRGNVSRSSLRKTSNKPKKDREQILKRFLDPEQIPPPIFNPKRRGK